MSEMVKLGDVVEKATGARNPTKTPDSSFIYVDVAAVDNTEKSIVGARSISGSEAPSRARKVIRAGDILVSTVRPNLNAVALVPATLNDQVASTGFCVLRATAKVLPEYLFFFVRSRAFVDGLSSLVAGAMYPAVSDSQVLDQLLPLPPLPEQHRIVDLLSRADGIVRLRREAEKKAAELIPALFLDMFGDPATNPKGWPIARLGEISTVKGGGTPSKSNPAYWAGEIPWVSPKDMGGVERVSNAIDHISQEALSGSATNLIPAGAILVVTRSGVLKHSLPCAITSRPVAINQDIKAFLPNECIHPNFLLAQLQFRSHEILGLVRVGATVQNIETDALKRLHISLPPKDLQVEFAQRIEQIQSIRTQQAAASVKSHATFDAMLARVFNQ